MKSRSAIRLAVTLALGALLFSCTAQGGSIYAIIETAKKTYVSTLDTTLTVLDLVNTGSTTLPYFVAAGAVYNGTPPNLNNVIGWPNYGANPIPVSPPVSGALCTALVFYNTTLYGAFFTSNGSTMGLYQSPPTNPSFSTPVADSHVAGKQITLLQVANGNLCAVVATPSSGTSGFTYELDYSTNGISFSLATGLTGLTTPITGVGFQGGTYYVTTGSALYSGGALGTLSAGTISGPDFSLANGEVLNGVTVDNGYVFIPSSNGAVYYYNGSAWNKASTSDSINSRSIIFLTVSTNIDTSAPPGTGVIYIAGADGAGFYYLNLSNNSLARFSDVTVTGLYAGAVRRVLVDPVQNNTVFLGTAGTGLWRANFDPSTGAVISTWIQE